MNSKDKLILLVLVFAMLIGAACWITVVTCGLLKDKMAEQPNYEPEPTVVADTTPEPVINPTPVPAPVQTPKGGMSMSVWIELGLFLGMIFLTIQIARK